ncbi:unnamed protein product [Prorocentrum cordatum]|uniref:Uncharacterized protein n=1 Tax=Prorocentrum cordatum TaxID=2364126 RepID=A0ABN9VB09_9DINO|nr:unnamed protein product [Polarella glacialis]
MSARWSSALSGRRRLRQIRHAGPSRNIPTGVRALLDQEWAKLPCAQQAAATRAAAWIMSQGIGGVGWDAAIGPGADISRYSVIEGIALDLKAEAQLDAMASEDFAADFAARWSEGLRLAEGEARAGGRRQLELQAKVGGHLSLAADAQRRHADLAAARAKAAGAAAAAAEAAGEEQRRAAEEADRARVEAALREAEQQRLVPVKVKVQGLRMSRISDIQQFGQNFANSVQAL